MRLRCRGCDRQAGYLLMVPHGGICRGLPYRGCLPPGLNRSCDRPHHWRRPALVRRVQSSSVIPSTVTAPTARSPSHPESRNREEVLGTRRQLYLTGRARSPSRRRHAVPKSYGGSRCDPACPLQGVAAAEAGCWAYRGWAQRGLTYAVGWPAREIRCQYPSPVCSERVTNRAPASHPRTRSKSG